MNNKLIIVILFTAISCSFKPEDALLHPPPNQSALENLPSHLEYLQKIVTENNRQEVIKKSLQLLHQSGWPNGYEPYLQELTKDVNISDSTTLNHLITYYQVSDNQYMMKQYTKVAIDLGYYSSQTLHALSAGFYNELHLDSAIHYILKAIKKEPDYNNWILKAKIETSQKDTASAINSYIKALQIKHLETQELIPFLFLLYSSNNQGQALSIGAEHLQTDSTSSKLILCLARINQQSGNTETAINLLRQLPPESMERLNRLVDIFNKHKRYDDIIYETNSALEHVALEKPALLARARAFEKKWLLKKSITTFQYLFQIDSSDQVVKKELDKVKGKAAYLRRLKESDTINNTNTLNE